MPSGEADERTRVEIFDQPDSIEKTLAGESRKLDEIAKTISEDGKKKLYIVGMGSSFAAALGAKMFAEQATKTPVEVFRGREILFDNPVALGRDSCVVTVSFSGETQDVVSALRFAKERKAYTVAITGPEENTLAKESDASLQISSRDTKAMVAAYPTQLVLLYLLLGQMAKRVDRSNRVDTLRAELDKLVPRLRSLIPGEEPKAKVVAQKLKDREIIYVISAGPNYGLAYKLAMTEITENAWVHGVAQYTTEFLHGIVEKIEKDLPVIFLLGTDQSRDDVLRDMKSCQKLGATTVAWDAIDFPKTDPFLTPIYLSIPTEWFVYHLALMRGKVPSSRRYMGSAVPYANMKSLSKTVS
jgi:glucosamine--fructose-6-phosphate aminotransferase (isomerizing)